MSTHKHIEIICCVVLAFTLILTVLFINAEHFGVQKVSAEMEYEEKLFDTSKVHTIDIIMDDWDEFTANCKSEEYYACTVVIDNETYQNVAIRGKGNTSLSRVTNDRYSYKIEFDHYSSTNTYYGLDKLCLNNIIQDNTYMKDYLTYQMMNEMGVASPLCSYAYITVNGEDWGLYLAAEGLEESFLQRNYGKDYGELYKPDSMSMGGGRGNGEKFDMDAFLQDSESESTDNTGSQNNDQTPNNDTIPQMPNGNPNTNAAGQIHEGMGGQRPNENGDMSDTQMAETMSPPADNENNFSGQMPGNRTLPLENGNIADSNENENTDQNNRPKGIQTGSDDVLLKYIDDHADSYSNIFENAKTDITEADKNRLIKALKNLSEGEDLESTVDIDAVIRYFVVHNFVLNFDSYTGSMVHNYYLYEKDGQMQMLPWDYNLAFGGFQSTDDATGLVNYPIDSPVSGGSTEDRPMIAWIFANDEYTELYHQYFEEFIIDYFDSGYFTTMIDSVEEMISPYVEKDPTKFCTCEEFEKGITTLKEFCLLRAESVSAQLDGIIGSSSDTQNSDTLIDAGDIQINDMGSMGNTIGGGNEKSESDTQKPQTDAEENETTASTDQTPSAESEEASNDSSENRSVSTIPDGQTPNANQDSFDGEQMQGGAPPELPDSETGNSGDPMQQSGEENTPQDMEQRTPRDSSSISAASLIPILVSIFVLCGGLCFALFYKRRK